MAKKVMKMKAKTTKKAMKMKAKKSAKKSRKMKKVSKVQRGKERKSQVFKVRKLGISVDIKRGMKKQVIL